MDALDVKIISVDGCVEGIDTHEADAFIIKLIEQL